MKNYLFLTKDGFTYDLKNLETENLQVLGTGVGINVNEAFISFKQNQSYLSRHSYRNIISVEYVGDFIMDLEL